MHTWESFRVRGQPTQASMHRDVYEWPFELYIPGNWDETFKGCRHCGVAYRLEATTSLQDSKTDVFTFAPIRVTRSPTVSSYELLDPVMTHGKWGAKAEYNISLRHQAIAVGGLIPVDVELGMLEPGVELKKAKFYLTETHIVHDESKSGAASFLGDRLVEEWNMEIVEPDQQVHSWEQCLSLPRIVSRCSPDFSICGMTISHTFHFRATLWKDGLDMEVSSRSMV
jgi:arrestin-related trafficking adapter 4/5/7